MWEGHAHTAVFKMDNEEDPLTAKGSLLCATRQPGWEGSLGEDGYMYMCG